MMMTTPCEQVRGWLLDNDPSELPASLETHATTCGGCTTVLETTRRLVVLGQTARAEPTTEHTAPWNGTTPPSTAIRMSSRTAPTRWWGSKWFLGSAAAAALVAAGVAIHDPGASQTRRGEPADRTGQGELAPTSQELAFVATMLDRFKGPDGTTDLTALREDPRVREEYLAYLDHASTNVRRMAMNHLMSAGVDIPPRHLRLALDPNLVESMDEILVVAAKGSRAAANAYMAEFRNRRASTLNVALGALGVAARKDPAVVPSADVEPYVTHTEPTIRALAISALRALKPFSARDLVADRLQSDPDGRVRVQAGLCLLDQVPAEAYELVRAQALRESDRDVQADLLMFLARDPQAIEFIEQFIRREDTHERVVARLVAVVAKTVGAETLIEPWKRVAQSRDPEVEALAYAAAFRMGLNAERSALEAKVLDAEGDRLGRLSRHFILWSMAAEPPDWDAVRRVLPQLRSHRGSWRVRSTSKMMVMQGPDEMPTEIRDALLSIAQEQR